MTIHLVDLVPFTYSQVRSLYSMAITNTA